MKLQITMSMIALALSLTSVSFKKSDKQELPACCVQKEACCTTGASCCTE